MAIAETPTAFADACVEVADHSCDNRDGKAQPVLLSHRWDAIADRILGLVEAGFRETASSGTAPRA